jgi:uncharacterized protein (UPF0264 family)
MLLLSVKNISEAHTVVAQAEHAIIDIKDPGSGSLGFAGDDDVNEIATVVGQTGKAFPISVAMGELRLFESSTSQRLDWDRIDYVKFGLSQCYPAQNNLQTDHPAEPQTDTDRWLRPLVNAFAQIPRRVKKVMVFYVDQVNLPTSLAMLRTAVSSPNIKISAVLVDTFDKSHGNAFAHWDPLACQSLFRLASVHGLTTVMAGSIDVQDLAASKFTGAEVIGVRGAVCVGRRDGNLSSDRLKRFINAYHRQFKIAKTWQSNEQCGVEAPLKSKADWPS